MAWRFDNIPEWQASIVQAEDQLKKQTEAAVRLGTGLITAFAQTSFGPAHPRNSPKTSMKPQSQTPGGDLRRSIQMLNRNQSTSIGLGLYRGQVAPQTTYGRRVELGFFDMTDSLGRHYMQPPYPYLQPGLLKATPGIDLIFKERWGKALDWR